MNLFRLRLRLAGTLLVLVLVAAACGADAQVAEVGDQTLTEGGLVDLLEDPIGDPAQIGDQVLTPDGLDALVDGTVDKQEAAGAITGWARNELWYSALAAREFEIDDSFFAAARAEMETIALADPTVPALDTARGELIIRSQALAPVVAAYLLDVVGVEPAWPVQLCSSHILLETEEEALATIDRLEAGEDFAALAAELSIGPSGPAGGDLGCVDPSSFVSEYVEGAALVEAPGVSAPVESQFGWHVIDVRSFGATPSDDPVAIQNAVFSTSEFSELRDDVFARDVVVDPAYGVWDPDSLSVVPADG